MIRFVALAASALLVPLAPSPAPAAPTRWRIDPAGTSIGFVVDAVGFPRTRGTFSRFRGDVTLDFSRPGKSRVVFRVEAASVDVGSASFDDYLRSDAFFDAAKHPFVDFVSTSVKRVDATHAEVVGDLTLRGVTRPITVEVSVDRAPTTGARALAFVATGHVPRLAYGMKAGFPAISNDVKLVVKTRAVQR